MEKCTISSEEAEGVSYLKKEIINEIYWLRTIACLAVVGVHSITSGLGQFHSDSPGLMIYMFYALNLALMFGTPTFVFISEFLLAKNYPDSLPKDFFKVRVKILLLPYIFMGIVYAIVFAETRTFTGVAYESLRNIFLAEYVAYFIIVIFQFYILHFLLTKKLQQWNPKYILLISLVINVIYLGVFNFLPAPNGEFFEYFWLRGHWVLIPAWTFYFSLCYYAGRNYKSLKERLNKVKVPYLIIAPIILILIAVVLRVLELPGESSSKRIDILFYTISMIFLIMFISSKFKSVPSFIMFISKYSFSIYLIHKLIIGNLGVIGSNILIHSISVFFISLIGSILISYTVNLTPFGKYLVGKINVPKFSNQMKPIKRVS